MLLSNVYGAPHTIRIWLKLTYNHQRRSSCLYMRWSFLNKDNFYLTLSYLLRYHVPSNTVVVWSIIDICLAAESIPKFDNEDLLFLSSRFLSPFMTMRIPFLGSWQWGSLSSAINYFLLSILPFCDKEVPLFLGYDCLLFWLSPFVDRTRYDTILADNQKSRYIPLSCAY